MMNAGNHLIKWIINLSSVLLVVFFQLYMVTNLYSTWPIVLALITSSICIAVNEYIILREEKIHVHKHISRVALIVGIAGLMLSFFFLAILIMYGPSNNFILMLE